VRTGSLGPDFRRLWIATAVTNLGDGMRFAALPLLTASLTRDPQLVAGVTVAAYIPWVLFGLPGGAIVDRVDRRVLVRNIQVLRGLLMGALAVTVLLNAAEIWFVYTVAFLIGTGEVLADSASQTMVKELVPRDRLEDGYGRMFAADLGANELVGPPIGGLLFAIRSHIPFFGDAASYLAAGALVHRLPKDAFRIAQRAATTIRADIVEGLRFLWAHKLLRVMMLSVSTANLLTNITGAIFVLYCLEVLDTGAAGFGLILSAGGIGGLLGTTVAPRIVGRIGRARVIWGGTILTGLSIGAFGFNSDPIVAGVLQALFIFAIAMWNVVGRALRAAITPDNLLGRVVSGGRLLGYGAVPTGAAIGGWLADQLGLRTPFFIAGGATILLGLITAIWVNDRTMAAARTESGLD
jgi:MFS family permease